MCDVGLEEGGGGRGEQILLLKKFNVQFVKIDIVKKLIILSPNPKQWIPSWISIKVTLWSNSRLISSSEKP